MLASEKHRIGRVRWPDGVRCPYCASATCVLEVSGPRLRWRCGRCRRRFSWTTGTALHSTKLSARQWLAAAALDGTRPEEVGRLLGVSPVTARRVASLLAAAGGPPAEQRLRRLLSQPRPEPRRSGRADRWSAQGLLAVSPRSEQLLAGLTESHKRILNALRHRQFGATSHTVAALGAVSVGHTRRCLRDLERRGWAQRATRACAWGHRQVRARLWRLTWTGECCEVLGCLRRLPVTGLEPFDRDGVPPEFWHNFWSGTPADSLSISRHGLLIAETLVNGRDPLARAWALQTLPVETLAKCRRLRGCNTGAPARWLDIALESRSA